MYVCVCMFSSSSSSCSAAFFVSMLEVRVCVNLLLLISRYILVPLFFFFLFFLCFSFLFFGRSSRCCYVSSFSFRLLAEVYSTLAIFPNGCFLWSNHSYSFTDVSVCVHIYVSKPQFMCNTHMCLCVEVMVLRFSLCSLFSFCMYTTIHFFLNTYSTYFSFLLAQCDEFFFLKFHFFCSRHSLKKKTTQHTLTHIR